MSRVCFTWTSEGLAVANQGKPFTVGGLAALCSSHRSDETERNPKPFRSAAEAEATVCQLRENRLAAYDRCPGDIVEHARAEREMGLDYTNRLLLELLQNADDAAASDDPIGYKGLGFKAVLDVAAHVRIRSGHLKVRFDRRESQEAVRAAGLQEVDEIPVLRLPFWDDQEAGIPGDEEGFATVVFLAWKSSAQPSGLFAKEWEAISDDATILLFLHAVRRVTWQPLAGDPVDWRCTRKGDFRVLSVRSGSDVVSRTRWRIFVDPLGETTSSAAVRIDPDGNATPHCHNKIRVFFPTEEDCPVPMLLHGGFDVEQNRKRVRPGGNRSEVVRSLARCVKSVLASVQDDGTLLDLLTQRQGTRGGVESEIWDAIMAEVREMALPQSGVTIGDVRLCPSVGADNFPWYYNNRLGNWQQFKEALTRHRPGGLAALQLLPPGVDTEKREQVVCAFNPDATLSIDELRSLPLFPIEGGSTPIAASDSHLFFPAKGGHPRSAPEGIRIAFLQSGFAVDCEQTDLKELVEKLGVQEFKPTGIAKALAEQPLEAIDGESLWDYLMSVIAPLLKESDAVMDWEEKARERLAEQVKVPCREGHWKPAKSVYAGREWTGDDFLDRAYGSQQDRQFLAPPPADQFLMKQFELLARWLGVGWSPKVLPLVNETDKPATLAGRPWYRDSFHVHNSPTYWQEHCEELNRDGENERRRARLRQDWTLDGGARLLGLTGAFACVLREWRNYKDYLQAVFYRSSNVSKDNDNERESGASHLAHLFRQVPWIPVEEAPDLVQASNVFMKGCEVHRGLAGWVFGAVDEPNEEVRKGIGIRASWEDVKQEDWTRWLARAVQCDASRDKNVRVQIKQLYLETLANSVPRYALPFRWSGEIWAAQKLRDNTEEWQIEADREKVFYVDRPDLARLRLEGLRVFPVELGWSGNKQKVLDIFRLHSLSEQLRGEPQFCDEGSQPPLANEVRKRLDERSDCLAAYLRVKGKTPASADEKWRGLVFRVGSNLCVRFAVGNRQLEMQSLATFFEPNSAGRPAALWLDATQDFTEQGQPKDILWEDVGSALCYVAGLALEDGAVFGGLLACDQDSLKRKLLNLGVTEADVAAALPRARMPKPGDLLQFTPTLVPSVPTLQPSTVPSSLPASVLPPVTRLGGGHRLGSDDGGTGGGGHGGGGGGGESPAHRELKNKLWEHPELIEPGMERFRYEPDLMSHYRPDLLLKDSQGRFVAVEVEAEFPGESDYGIWQAVAYKHVTAAEFGQPCEQVRGLLVAPRIPPALVAKCERLGVEPIEIGG